MNASKRRSEENRTGRGRHNRRTSLLLTVTLAMITSLLLIPTAAAADAPGETDTGLVGAIADASRRSMLGLADVQFEPQRFASSVHVDEDADAPGATHLSAAAERAVSGSLGVVEVGSGVVSLVPARLLETRSGSTDVTVDGLFEGVGRVVGGGFVEVDIAGRGGVPEGVGAAVMNVTAVGASAGGFVTVYPCGDVPKASTLNFWPGVLATANEVVAKLSGDGTVCLFARSDVDLLVDVVGYVESGSGVVSLVPARLLETRSGPADVTVDGLFEGVGRVVGGGFVEVDIAGRGGVPSSGVSAAVMNVTAVGASAGGFVTVYPCGDVPKASTLNFWPGVLATANEVVAKLSGDGTVCLFARSDIDLLVDVVGYVESGSGVESLVPARLLETRSGPTDVTVDGLFEGVGRVVGGGFIEVDIAGRGGVPSSGVSAAVMNVTAVGASAGGFVTVYPCGDVPKASTLNFWPGVLATANEVVAKLSGDGTVCLFARSDIDLLIDVTGYITDSASSPVVPTDLGNFAEGWKVIPDNALLTTPDATAALQLIHFGDDGEPSGRAVPAGTKVVSAAQAGIEFAVAANGVITVSRGAAAGDELAKIDIEGETVGPILVTAATLNPDVIQVDSSRVLFPLPDDDTETFDPAPFTPGEFDARVTDPESSFAASQDPDTPPSVTFVMPYVISGEAPPAGQLVIAGGAIPMMGKIVERPGLPTLERGGYSLISVEMTPVGDIFQEVDSAVSMEMVEQLGLPVNLYEETDPSDEGAAFGSFTAPQGDFADLNPKVLLALGKLIAIASKCSSSTAAISIGQLKVLTFDPGIDAIFDSMIRITPNYQFVRLEMGAELSPKFTSLVEIQAGLSALLKCKMGETYVHDFTPPGWLGLIASATVFFEQYGELEILAEAGPKISAEVECSAYYLKTLGFLYTTVLGFSSIGQSESRDPSCTPSYSVANSTGVGTPTIGQVNARWKPTIGAGVRIGGRLSQWVAEAGGYLAEFSGGMPTIKKIGKKFGVIELLTGFIGVEAEMKVENTASTLAQEKTSTGGVVKLIGGFDIITDRLQAYMDKLLAGLVPGGSILRFRVTGPNFEQELGKLVDLPVAGDPEMTLSNQPVSGTVEVEVGKLLEIDFEMTPGDALYAPDVDMAQTYLQTGSGLSKTFEEFDLFRFGPRGNTMHASEFITGEMCLRFSEGKTLVAVGEAGGFPVWLGRVELTCDIDVTIDPTSVDLTFEDGDEEVSMTQVGLDGVAWYTDFTQEPPEGYNVYITPPEATFPTNDAADDPIELEVRLACAEGATSTATATFVIMTKVEVPLDEDPTGYREIVLSDPVTANLDCNRPYFYINEDEVTAPGVVTFDTDGEEDDMWTGPFEPSSGFLKGTESDDPRSSVTSAQVPDPRVQPRIPGGKCMTDGLGPLPRTEEVQGANTEHRGSDTVLVIFPAKPPVPPKPIIPCDPPPPCTSCGDGGDGGGSWGDPHMTSFDGFRYDAQVMGEYVYAENEDGSTRIVARFEETKSTLTIGRPSSTIGMSYELNGHHVEAYSRPRLVLVDGAIIAPGQTLVLDGGVTVAYYGGTLTVETATLRSVTGLNDSMDVKIYPLQDATLLGMLGTNDGFVGNDLLVNGGGAITFDEAYEHDTAFYSFTDSWRITDEGESPFTVPYDGFDAPNEPRPSTEAMQPFIEQATEILAGLGAICSAAATHPYTITMLALELSIGEVPADLTQSSCEYAVRGVVTVAGSATPAIGVSVSIDANGLLPCETVTSSSGVYHCTTAPDIDELAAITGEVLPIVVDVSASTELLTDAASDTVSFVEFPGFGGTAIERVDLEVPLAAVKMLTIDGTVTRYGVPVSSANFDLIAYDSGGATVLSTLVAVTPNIETGSIEPFSRALPANATSAVLQWRSTDPGAPSATIAALEVGLTTRTIDFDLQTPAVVVHGTALYNGETPDSVRARVSTDAGFSIVRWIPTAVDGSFSELVEVPAASTTVTVEAVAGHVDNAPVSVTVPFVAGPVPTEVEMIVAIDAPDLEMSGTFDVNGVPFEATVRIDLVVERSGGPDYTTHFNARSDEFGDYLSPLLNLPDDTTSVTATARFGPTVVDYPVRVLPALSDGLNDIDVDFSLVAPRLDVSGVVRGGGEPAAGALTFDIVSTAGTAFETALGTTVAPDGSYAFDVVLPLGVTAASVTARSGFSVADHRTTSHAGLVSGANAVSFDVDFDAVAIVLDGRITNNGSAVPSPDLYVEGYTGSDVLVKLLQPRVITDALGDYTTILLLPTDVVAVSIASSAAGSGIQDRLYEDFSGLGVGSQDVTFNDLAAPPVVELSGNFTSNDASMSGFETLTIEAVLDTGGRGDDAWSTTRQINLSLVDGGYSTSFALPRSAQVAYVYAPFALDPVDYPVFEINPVSPGTTQEVWDLDLDLGVTVELTIDLADSNGPITGPVDLTYSTRTRNQNQPILTDVPLSVVLDGSGQVVVPFELSYQTGIINIVWDIGLPEDPPLTIPVAGLIPGVTSRIATGRHLPPVLTLDGTATANGAPYDGHLTLVVSAAYGQPAPMSFEFDVMPNAAGEYSLPPITLPRATGIVTMTATPDHVPSLAFVETFDPPDGAQAVDFDPTFDGPVLRGSGMMTDGDGPVTVPVTVGIALTGDGAESAVFDLSVTPDGSGTYEIVQVLPGWATTASLTYVLGGVVEDYPIHEETALLLEDREFVFDAAVEAQRLDVAGVVSIGAGTWPEGDIEFLIDGLTTNGPFSETVTATVDGSGAYSLEFVPPAVASSVTITAASNLWHEGERASQTFGGLEVGVEPIAFSPGIAGRLVVVRPTFYLNAIPITDGFTWYIESRRSAGGVAAGSTDMVIVPDAAGKTEQLLVVAAEATHVAFGNQFGAFASDLVFTEQTINQSNPVDVFTYIEYVTPPDLTVAGAVTLDEAPFVGDVTFDITWELSTGGIETSNVVATADGSGDYSFEVVGPRLTSRTIIVPTIPTGFTADRIDSAGLNGIQDVMFPIDFSTTTLVVSGTFDHYFHGMYDIEVTPYAGAVALDTIYLDVSSVYSGPFSAATALDESVTSVDLLVAVDDYWGSGYGVFTRTVPITQGAENVSAGWDIQTITAEIDGQAVDENGPMSEVDLEFSVYAYDSEVNEIGVIHGNTYTDFDGYFELYELVLPEGTASFHYDLYDSENDRSGSSGRVDVDPSGHSAFGGFIIDLSNYANLVGLGGTITSMGATLTSAPTFALTEYDMTLTGVEETVPVDNYPVAAYGYDPAEPDKYVINLPSPHPDTDLFRLDIYLPDEDITYTRFYDFRDMDEYRWFFDQDLDHTGRYLYLHGYSVMEDPDGYCIPDDGEPFVFGLTVTGDAAGTVYADMPVVPYDYGEFELYVPITTEDTDITIEQDTQDYYGVFTLLGSSTTTVTPALTGETDVELVMDNISCAI